VSLTRANKNAPVLRGDITGGEPSGLPARSVFAQADFTGGPGFSPARLLRLLGSSRRPTGGGHHHRSGVEGVVWTRPLSPCPEDVVYCPTTLVLYMLRTWANPSVRHIILRAQLTISCSKRKGLHAVGPGSARSQRSPNPALYPNLYRNGRRTICPTNLWSIYRLSTIWLYATRRALC